MPCRVQLPPPTTGAEGLSIHLTPQVAVLRIVKNNDDDKCDINVMIGDKWVSSLTAKTNEVGFSVTTSSTKVSLLSKNGDAAGTYYVAVPAGVRIAVYNGNKMLKSTKDAGLKVGKYYTITTAPVSGSEYATINGTTEKIGWVQLWAGGPKFATQNVENKMSWTDAAKTGNDYVWGKNWRTPKKEEMSVFVPNAGVYGTGYEEQNKKSACTATYKSKDGVYGVEFTGNQPGYTKATLFLPTDSKDANYAEFHYFTSSKANNSNGSSLAFMCSGGFIVVHPYDNNNNTATYFVRPVLAN